MLNLILNFCSIYYENNNRRTVTVPVYMKKIIFYFDPTAKKMLTETISETGEKKLVLSSTKNFVYTAEIVARIIDIDNDEQIPTRLDPGYNYHVVMDYFTIKADRGSITMKRPAPIKLPSMVLSCWMDRKSD